MYEVHEFNLSRQIAMPVEGEEPGLVADRADGALGSTVPRYMYARWPVSAFAPAISTGRRGQTVLAA